MHTIDPDLERAVRTLVEDLDLEYVGVDYRPGNNGLLRLYIDAEAGVTVDDCSAVSRELSALLDVEDPLQGHYTLEVSSPGLERPLFTAAHFQRFAGENIRLVSRVMVSGRRRFRGRLECCDGEFVEVSCDGVEYRISLSDIESARLQPTNFMKANVEPVR